MRTHLNLQRWLNVSTHFEDSALDPKQVEDDVHDAVRRWRTSIRKGRQLLKLTQTERPQPGEA